MKTQDIAVFSLPAVLGALFFTYLSGSPGFSRVSEARNPASDSQSSHLQVGLDGWLAPADNAALWNHYCIGNADSADIPRVNYADPEVQAALSKLKLVADKSYYLYGEFLSAYGLRQGKALGPQPGLAADIPLFANAYLVYLCGEFRDRATMVKAKLNWISHIAKLSVKPQTAIDPSRNLWSQVSAESYRPFLVFSRDLWNARKKEIGTGTVMIGSHQVDGAVPGMTVCETRFIFSQYIAASKTFGNLAAFRTALSTWGDPAQGNCLAADHEQYYDFRGDTNFKPNSPEGNGMIWRAKHMAKFCKDTRTSSDPLKVSDFECEDYFHHPFARRWAAARAGLTPWLFYDTSEEKIFSETRSLMVIFPHKEAEIRPYSYAYALGAQTKTDRFLPAWKELDALPENRAYLRTDLGFNEVMGLGTAKADSGLAYERLKNSVDRHTDWYASGYDDGRGTTAVQAYSPFVASSYEMSQSDQFTSCGVTIPCTAEHDDRKHWMLIFRVKKADWYTTDRLARSEPLDLSRMWFDETSFGTTGLAKNEHAWDRLGTAMEGEYDSIVYLHNITKTQEIKDDGMAGNP